MEKHKSLKISIELHKELKVYCAENSLKLNNWVEEILTEKIKELKMKKITTDEFIKRSKEIHGIKYDYSLVKYDGMNKKVKIICKIHGIFEQQPHNHLNGFKCAECGGVKNYTTDEFIKKSKEIHGDKYDYSLVNYINNKTKVKIICPIHGIFTQIPNSHLLGIECNSCIRNILTTEQFIEKVKNIHNNKYDYSSVYYKNTRSKIDIICSVHGVFNQKAADHLLGCGCPSCLKSNGEINIKNILERNNIKFDVQKTFDGCINKRKLKFDFYLPNYNICIEFDGEQHFKIIEKWGGQERLNIQQKMDQIKNEYCKNNNIHLVRIKYDENILEKLENILKITPLITTPIVTN